MAKWNDLLQLLVAIFGGSNPKTLATEMDKKLLRSLLFEPFLQIVLFAWTFRVRFFAGDSG
jgi:hypothetical protein